VQLPKRYPFQGEWGEPLSMHLLERETFPAPYLLDMVWLSLTEHRFYSVYEDLPEDTIRALLSETDDLYGGPLYGHIVVGMAPYGGIAVWVQGTRKSTLIRWIQGETVHVAMSEFLPMNPNATLDEYCMSSLDGLSEVRENLEQYGLPSKNLYDKYMQQFCYRYKVMFGKWNEDEEKWVEYEEGEVEPEMDSLEEMLYDGTHDKLNDGRLLKLHEAGKPKKLAVKWHVKKKEYAAYFWFVDEEIRAVFDRFYGTHPETRTDLMVRIDPERNKFQLAMYRQGLQEPYIIPETAYELLVFRNKFECFRSENYSQATGAWIW
jgi:hypothetical protein